VTTKPSFFSLRTGFLTGPQAYAVTLVTTGLATLLTIFAAPTLVSTPFMLPTAAVIVSTWFGGFRQGFIAAVVGAAAAEYYVLAPQSHWSFVGIGMRRTILWIAFATGLAFLLSRLRKSEDHARKVLASITEGLLIVDRDWTLLYANDSGAQFVGKPQGEIIGRNYWELSQSAISKPMEQQLRRCATERIPVQFESHCQRRQNWIQVRAYPFPEGISVFIQDISETKLKEEAQRAVLDRLSTAHKAAQMGTWDWNIKNNDLIWSDEIPRIHGLRPQEFDGKLETWLKTIHPDDLPGVQAKIQRALEDKQEYYAEFRVIWPNGETHWICGHGRVIVDAAGVPVRMVGIGADITHHHMEEEALRRSEKLAAAGRLAATIAHEINNPLEAVTNLVYLIRQDATLSLEARSLLRTTDEQLSRVNHIARQTLGFYRDHNTPETVDLAEIIEELLAIFHTRLTARQISVVKEYESVGAITAFRGELQQVLSNLLTNAIDASAFGSKLVLRVKPEPFVEGGVTPEVRVEVEDFGSGIQWPDQERIFEPFFTTKSEVGTGLGLWVSKQIVEKNGGRIGFYTKCDDHNTGTCFFVVMPVTTGVV